MKKQNTISIYEAKTNLSKYLKQASQGKTIYIGAYGIPQAKLMPLSTDPPIRLGVWSGKHKIAYSDRDIIDSDSELIDSIDTSEIMPNDSK